MMIENTNQPERNTMLALRKKRAPSHRKGSVLVLVVGVLAVLAAMALSYITIVRIDRRSTDAYQEQENLQQQVVAVTSYLQALLTADLFGNQMTNASTPKVDLFTNELIWPKAFADGEYFDYPWTDVDPTSPGFTWNTNLPDQSPSSNSRLPRPNGDRRAFADDAWLSPIEPIDTGDSSGEGIEWDTWPQITNLLSAYRYRRLPNSTQRVWFRDTGRFVDLGQLLLQRPINPATPRHGFPGADLTLNKDGALWKDPDSTTNPPNQLNGPALGVNQKIFDLQMADLQEEFYWPTTGTPSTPLIQGQRELLPADERFWADTDGDGRPDARWQQLDALGNAFGKVWVIAVRIIDNSAMANVNSHISFMDYANPSIFDRIGDGRTPADVDLYRLFASQIAGSITAHTDISWPPMLFDVTRLNDSFREHLFNGLRVPSMLSQLDQLDAVQNTQGLNPLGLRDNRDFVTIGETWPATLNLFDDDPLLSPLELKRVERAAIWRFFGSSPLAPVASTGAPYPYRDEIDLRTFSGYNLLRTVSRIEQRFDGPRPIDQTTDGFLPGVTPRYNDTNSGPVLGPMRSKEWDIPSQSPRTFTDTFILDDNFGNGLYTNSEKLERQRKDIRHLLTTISGSGSIGPVPVLNPVFDRQFSTRKVDLRLFGNPPTTSNQPFNLLHADRIRQPLTDAFSAFLWALAPLATNQPLMSPLDRIDSFTYAQLADDADLHYGGGVAGPAQKIITAPDQIYGGSVTDMGASYAVLRAAALAVNLADAIDNETPLDVLDDLTTETPTMVRLFNQLDLSLFLSTTPGSVSATLGEDLRQQGVIALGVRFPQGDIWSDSATPPSGIIPNGQNQGALPREVVGDPENGVTLVGLDRQPFLVRALTVAVYADQGSYLGQEGLANTQIDPLLTAEQLGSLFVVELGNPWPEPIDLAGYLVRIASGPNAEDLFELSFSASTIDNNTTINPGSRTAFYYFQGPSGDAPAGAQADWDTIRDQLKTEIDGQGGADEVRKIEILMPNPPDGGVMFQNVGGGPFPVLLIRTIVTGAGTTEVLVDRMSPDPASTDPFPAVLTEAVDLQPFVTTPPMGGLGVVPSFTGRIAVQSVLRRPTLPGTAGGFPSYVVERPVDNIQNFQDFDSTVQVWEAFPDLEPIKPIEDLGQDVIDNTGGTTSGSEINLIAQEDGALNLAPFELFVPNGLLLATSELGLISVFAHMYIHLDQQRPSVLEAWDMSGFLGPGKWATVSEQLGWDAHFTYDTTQSPGVSNLNPYLGVLDLSRFILGVGGDMDATTTTVGQLLPDALAVPLATRVFDAFEAIPTPSGGFVQGRININTAPKRILELLPFVDPRDPITGNPLTNIANWNPSTLMIPGQPAGDTRLDWLERYRRRDVDVPGFGGNTTSNDATPNINNTAYELLQDYTNLTGLRNIGQDNNQSPWSLGLVNTGELATMGRWSNTTPFDGSIDQNSPAFLELGANGDSSQRPLDIRPLPNFEAVDDPEERLAIFRAISNIVSTRSDIFTAWFILRAYDPKDIEAITIPLDLEGDENAIVSLMNPGNPNGLDVDVSDNPGLIPSFERRVLVIFDRSNVTRPTDRPRIVLQVELPIR